MAAGAAFEDFVPPHNVDAEMGALGSAMLSETAAEEVLSELSQEDFYRPAHRELFQAMLQLYRTQTAIDLVTVKNELAERGKLQSVGGTDYLIQVVDSVVTPANASHYAQIVKDKATVRRLIDAGHEIVKSAHDSDLDTEDKIEKAEGLVYQVGQTRLGKEFAHVKDLAMDFFEAVDKLYETGEPILGLQSKFTDLDKMTGGFYRGEFTIVAARPAMGKTSLVLNFALNVARHSGKKVAVFSLEMSGESLVRRLLSMISGVSMGILKNTRLPDDDYQKLLDACEVLYALPIFIDDTSDINPLEMRGKCRRLNQNGELGLVVIDYLQLMRGVRKTDNRAQEISDIARALKSLAKELDVPVIALSQLNRGVEARDDKRPRLSDLRESGSIEAEADLVMFIYRPEYYERKGEDYGAEDPDAVTEAEIIIAKHRNGPTGTVTLGFQPSYTRFRNLYRGE